MTTQITPAQAWAVIAESAGWNEKELPVLPDLYETLRQGYWQQESEDFFVCLTKNDSLAMADKLEPLFQAYGQQCAAHAREVALEEAAQVCKDLYKVYVFTAEAAWHVGMAARECAAAIEALKKAGK